MKVIYSLHYYPLLTVGLQKFAYDKNMINNSLFAHQLNYGLHELFFFILLL